MHRTNKRTDLGQDLSSGQSLYRVLCGALTCLWSLMRSVMRLTALSLRLVE